MGDDWAQQHAPKPGDLVYSRDPNSGEVFTDQAWTILEVEGTLPADRMGPGLDWATYWNVWVQCDAGIAGRCPCGDDPNHVEHAFLLSAGDFVSVAEVTR